MVTIRDLRCAGCGTPTARDDSFCGYCGVPLRSPGNGGRRPAPHPLPLPPDDLVTRHLCATAHLDDAFAALVADQVVDGKQRAIHPCPGVNLLAVTRHAAAARAATRLHLFIFAMVRIAALTFFIMLVRRGQAGMEDIWSALPAALQKWLDKLLLVIPTGRGTLLLLILFLLFLLFLELLLFMFRWQALSRVLEIMIFDGESEELAPAVDGSVEERLVAVDSSDVIVFSGLFRGVTPFAGSGRQISSWAITMDIASAGCDDYGEPLIIDGFDAADLHDWLAHAVPDNTLPGLTARERLYVSGVSAPLVPRLVPQPRRAPTSRIPGSVLTNALINPTDYARTYLCFEKSAWGGQFVFSYLVRAEILQGKTLFIEGVALAMLPLADRFREVEKVPMNTSARIPYCLGSIGGDLPAALFGRFLCRLASSSARRAKAEAPQPAPGTDKDIVVDYGAINSIRALAATETMPWYFVSVDEEMYLSVLQRRIMEGAVRFLREHGVDTSEFERQQTKIINNTHFGNVLNIGSVSGSGNVFGDNARITRQGPRGRGGGRR